MASKKNGGNVTAVVRALAEPLAEELGLRIWDVRFVKEGAEHYLRIFIDKSPEWTCSCKSPEQRRTP